MTTDLTITTKPSVKHRGGQLSRDGGMTWEAYGSNWDAPHMGASLTSRELANWNPVAGSADSDLLYDLNTLAPRSRDLDRNHGIASGARRTQLDNVVGIGLRLVPMPDFVALGKDKKWAVEWSRKVKSVWRPWAETTLCDVQNTSNFHGMTRNIFNGCMLNGEALALPMWMPSSRSKFATKIQVIESDRLSTPIGRIDGQYMRGGVQIDDYGKPLGYWIRKAHPGDAYIGVLPQVVQWEFIEAETPWGRKRVIHVHEQDRIGQHRGKPDLTAVLTQFKMLDHYQRTEIQAAVVQAMVAAFIETPMDSTTLATMFGQDVNSPEFLSYMQARNEYRVNLKGAAVLPLFPGDKLSPFTPTRPNNAYGPFVENVLRHTAVGLNMPYEFLMKDFSKDNYSSASAAVVEAFKFFIGRRKFLVDSWATPVYELWLEEAISLGLIDAPDYYDNVYAYSRCKWIGPGRGWRDPVKEAQGAQLRLDAYLSTLEEECAQQGLDWEEVLEQRSAERARLAELNLPLPEVIASRQPLQVEQAEQADNENPAKAPAGGPNE
jgi:lambda family phage portal protein